MVHLQQNLELILIINCLNCKNYFFSQFLCMYMDVLQIFNGKLNEKAKHYKNGVGYYFERM